MKKRLISILLCIVTILSLVGCGGTESKKTANTSNVSNSKSTEEEEIQETKEKLDKDNATTINYDSKEFSDIFDLYRTNQLQAKEKYFNKTVKITGEVSKITTDNGIITVSISTKEHSWGARLQFEDTKENHDKIINLKIKPRQSGETEGDLITAYGRFSRYDDINMVITDCEFA